MKKILVPTDFSKPAQLATDVATSIAKLTLSSATITLYFFNIIGGPFAQALMVLSAAVLVIYFIKTVFVRDD